MTSKHLLVFLCILPLGLAGNCTFKKEVTDKTKGTIVCLEINDNDYLYQMYKIEHEYQDTESLQLEIVNSNLPTLVKNTFLLPLEKILTKIERITIENSLVKTIEQEFFSGFAKMSYLNLTQNSISEYNFLKNCKNLQHLVISNSKETVIYQDIFNNLININVNFVDLTQNHLDSFDDAKINIGPIEVDLSYNNISTLNFAKNHSNLKLVLKGNSEIKSINVINNIVLGDLDLSEINSNGFNLTLLDHITVTNTLTLRGTAITPLQEKKNNLKIAKTLLDLSQVKLSTIPDQYFKDYYVDTLNLSGNDLKKLPENTFTGSVITVLDISHNKISDFSKLCSNTSVATLDISSNPIQNIDKDTFSSCIGLNSLNLTNTFIPTIANNSISTSTLYNLDISLKDPIDIPKIQNIYLQTLFIRNSNFSRLPEDIFVGFDTLQELYFYGSIIQDVDPNCLSGLFNLKKIDIHTLLSNVTTIPNGLFKDLNSLQELHLSNLNIEEISFEFLDGLESVSNLDLSNNKISNVSSGAFSNLESVQTLSLDNNLITNIPRSLFSTNVKIMSLNLSCNLLTAIEFDVFENLKYLNLLDLSHNRLTSLSLDIFISLNNLQNLNLENNKLHLVSYLGNQFDYQSIYGSNYKKIGVSGNQWECQQLKKMLDAFDSLKITHDPSDGMFNYSSINAYGIVCNESPMQNEFEELIELTRV